MAGGQQHLVIVGGGPAGMVAGLLFARAGVPVTVLEKHGDFLRDFRGDTVHPSTLRIFSELGLLDRLLERPHDKVHSLGAWVGDRELEIADMSGFDPRWNFIAMMPQWHFLDFVADEARRYPHFTLVMDAEAVGLVRREGRVCGVRYRSAGEELELAASLVIASDGRRSVLREDAQLPLRSFGAPMDVFWFRIPKAWAAENESTGVIVAGRIMALIDRGDYWQCAYVFAKGTADEVRGRGLDRFRADVAATARHIPLDVAAISSWDDVKLLTVALDRLELWHAPGLLVIGDAAHAMSPIGGVGINVAVQDAVAAANAIAGPMAAGADLDPLLSKVQERRLPAVRLIQGFQDVAQRRVVSRLLEKQEGPLKPAFALRLLNRFKWLRRFPAAFIGFGWKAEHVRSPVARHPGESRDLGETRRDFAS
ncbi:MAG TPA: FAD-dependent oxidoreductase [Allosphingosinicella sp.]|jgi:2-polyprenyl-6-methoxyphenol hydroxylase-like FAD-dependent oxidoreductase